MLKYFLKHVDGNLSKQIVTYIFDDIIHGHPKNVDIVCLRAILKWLEGYFDSVQLTLRLSDDSGKKREQKRILKAFDEDRKLVFVNQIY